MIVLASASPRRARLLDEAGIAHHVCPVRVDETPPDGATPAEAVMEIAHRKARAAAARDPGGIILAADTAVVLDGELIGKPLDAGDAHRILRALSGRSHEVLTGLCLLNAATGTADLRSESTTVTLRPLSAGEIEAYVNSCEPMDKAGAYGIQGGAGAFVASIDGRYDNVVGLPVSCVREMMEALA